MRKAIVSVMVCLIITLFVGGCGDSSEKQQQEENQKYFETVDLIKNGDYETALNNIENLYGNADYADHLDGANKMILYHLYYHYQQRYEEEMDVLLEYLQANNFEKIMESTDENADKVSIRAAIHSVSEILDKVSADKRDEVIQIVGKTYLDSVEKSEDN